MKLKCAAAAVALLISTAASADENGILFKVVLLKDGKVVASPSAVGEFGREVTVELAQTMKVVAVAATPNSEGHSLTAVKLSLFEGGAMQPGKEMSMLADLTKSPSFEYSVPGTPYRFVVMPRQVKLPDTKG
ncbi:hypothetical protein BWI17_21430 [Betaproteobacteria bacterium GR16-43]|nr:hypothetical protein BWI17_21430 [Betaproteobacteria bacterium GR16-43]